MRGLRTPQSRIQYRNFLCYFLYSIGRQIHFYFSFSSFIISFSQLCCQGNLSVRRSFISQNSFYLYNSSLLTHLRSSYSYPPMLYMNSIHRCQPHMPIDTCTGVPATIFLLRIIYPYSNNILIIITQIRSQIIVKR